ncbi:MAG: heme-binding beta-barrel domain-containing protein [Nitrospirales bacterium]|nr:heme-binding beta-barrel domain-containing protein [Nitrospirales bacterium]
MADEELIRNLGPLGPLAGTWEGDQGLDVAPSKKHGKKETSFREHMTFEPFGPVVNGSQSLYALRYRTTIWPLGEENPFHEEVGYWLWDAEAKQVLRCFIVPRGIAVEAGGTAEPSDTTLTMQADVGSETYGVLSNRYLDQHAKTVSYRLTVTIHDGNSFSYEEDTLLQIAGQSDVFHHTDKNTLRRITAAS